MYCSFWEEYKQNSIALSVFTFPTEYTKMYCSFWEECKQNSIALSVFTFLTENVVHLKYVPKDISWCIFIPVHCPSQFSKELRLKYS